MSERDYAIHIVEPAVWDTVNVGQAYAGGIVVEGSTCQITNRCFIVTYHGPTEFVPGPVLVSRDTAGYHGMVRSMPRNIMRQAANALEDTGQGDLAKELRAYAAITSREKSASDKAFDQPHHGHADELDATSLIPATVTPEGLRARAELVRGKLNDGGSCVAHLELAAARIDELETELAHR